MGFLENWFVAMNVGNFSLRILRFRKQLWLMLALQCSFLCLPAESMAEMNAMNHDIATSSITMSLPNELKAFNKQLSILERIVDKKVKANFSVK